MDYIFEHGFAVGYLLAGRTILFITPIPVAQLVD